MSNDRIGKFVPGIQSFTVARPFPKRPRINGAKVFNNDRQDHRTISLDQEMMSRRCLMTALMSMIPTSVAAQDVALSVDSSDLHQVTDRCYLEFGLCPEGVRSDRRLGDKSILCTDPAPLGRIAIDLYGRAAPGTVSAFKAIVAQGALNGTVLSKVYPGRWLICGQQGPRRSGLLTPLAELPPNPDLVSAAAFRLNHVRPGTVSLNLSENEDDEFIKMQKGYQPLSFLITTGPGPAPSLDGENIVFGRVTEGFDVIVNIANSVPTFQPNDSLIAYNKFAEFIGDDRASKTRSKWGKPLKAVVIVNSGIEEVTG